MSNRAQEIIKRVRRIELSTKRLIDTLLTGQYHTRFKGHGMQFSDLREYYLGDDIRHIDWKVTARTQSAHVKKFEEERELSVYFLVDLSASGDFGSVERTKREALAEVCALLAFAAVKNGDKVGVVLFTDRIEKHIPPKKGQGHALRIVTELLAFEPQGKGTDLKGALDYCLQVMKHKGILFVASDFYAEGYESPLKKLANRHDLIALTVSDPRESELPPLGFIETIDAETGRPGWVNAASFAFRRTFTKRREQAETEIKNRLSNAGFDRITLSTGEDYLKAVVEYFSRSRRKSTVRKSL
jgi:uncharacterized protein (DUF58 family)